MSKTMKIDRRQQQIERLNTTIEQQRMVINELLQERYQLQQIVLEYQDTQEYGYRHRHAEQV